MAESGIRAQNLLQYKKLGARMAHQTSGNKQLQTVPPLFGRLMDVSVLCPPSENFVLYEGQDSGERSRCFSCPVELQFQNGKINSCPPKYSCQTARYTCSRL